MSVVMAWMYDIQVRRNQRAACSANTARRMIVKALESITDSNTYSLLSGAMSELNTIDERLAKGPYHE